MVIKVFESIIAIEFWSMSLVETEQVGFLKLFTVAEQNLEINFKTIMERLDKHEQLLKSSEKTIMKHD